MKAFGPICSPGKTSNCNFVTFQLRAVFFLCDTIHASGKASFRYGFLRPEVRFRQTDILRPAKDRRRPLPQRCRKSDLQMRSGGHFCWRFLFSLLPHRFPADVQNKNKITHFVRTTFIPIQGLMADHQDPNTNIPIERQKKDTFTGSDRHSLAFVLCFFLCFVSSASCPPNPNPKYSTFVAATPLTQNAHVVWRLKGKLKQFIFVGHPSGLQGSFFRSFWGG